MLQKNKFIKDSIFHVCNKSIANFGILKDHKNAERFIMTLHYYNYNEEKISLSQYLRKKGEKITDVNLLEPTENNIVKFIAYKIMPDHYHLVIKNLTNNHLSKYINTIENSFTRYFNIRFNRKGPLWQSRFRSVLVKTSEQLLHLTRYVHLNAVTDYLVDKPEDWKFSSYRNYIDTEGYLKNVLTEITIKKLDLYKKFVENRIDYQRRLKKIKKFILE